MTDAMIVALVIGVSWVVFSLINICIDMAARKKGGKIHPFFLFCPVLNVLCWLIYMIVYFDEKKKGVQQ